MIAIILSFIIVISILLLLFNISVGSYIITNYNELKENDEIEIKHSDLKEYENEIDNILNRWESELK